MAKNKKNKSALPKRIAGVKVPKALRKGRAGRFLASPLGVALVSEAVVAAGAVAAGRQTRPGSAARKFADHPLASLSHLTDDAKARGAESAEALRGAFAAASVAFADALRSSADALDPSTPDPSTKKSSAREGARAT